MQVSSVARRRIVDTEGVAQQGAGSPLRQPSVPYAANRRVVCVDYSAEMVIVTGTVYEQPDVFAGVP